MHFSSSRNIRHVSKNCRLLLVLALLFGAASYPAAAQSVAAEKSQIPISVARASFFNPFAESSSAESKPSFPLPQTGLPQTNQPPHDVSWKTLPFDILHDQKYVWLFPVDLAHGKHWVPTLAIVGVTAALIASDPHTMPYFAKTTDFNRFNETFNGAFTGTFEAAVPASLYLYGLVRHSSYAEQTALLAAEAYADSAIPHVVIKVISRRYRPSAIPPDGDFSHTFFRSSTTPFGKGSSFPSGHAAGAFSIATVIAQRYGHHRWIPFAAYTIATVFAFSRVPDRAHFPSDVFLGAALGYTITRYDVFRSEP